MKPNLASFFKAIKHSVQSFSLVERILFVILLGIFFVTSSTLLARVSEMNTVLLPSSGGTLREGVVGTPRFINPLFASSPSELDITRLTYSGLMRKVDEGIYEPDLAESYEISDDGKIYTFHLRDNLSFHDGVTLDVDDIIFTIESAIDPSLKSPLAANWRGVTIATPNKKTITFNLSQPFAGFLDNTTLGILPEHIWRELDSEAFVFSSFNIQPVGSGPFSVKKIHQDKEGAPQKFILNSFENFTLGKPYINRLIIETFPQQEDLITAFNHGALDNAHSLPADSFDERMHTNTHLPLSRLFGLFFNTTRKIPTHPQKHPDFLASGIDKEKLVDDLYDGFATPLQDVLPVFMTSETPYTNTFDTNVFYTIAAENGFTINQDSGMLESSDFSPLSLSIATSDSEHLVEAAEHIKKQLTALGVTVEIMALGNEGFTETVLENRNFDVLLFGQSLPHDSALYAFWHSSQRTHPGLNIAQYTNVRTDRLLDQARQEVDTQARYELYRELSALVMEDAPMIPLLAPDFVYTTPKELQMSLPSALAQPHNRFTHIHEWYIRSHRVWKRFADK